jgi:hypothetical protein
LVHHLPYFVFVEFGSEPVREFLASLRVALTQSRRSSPIHVTLRGPYADPPPLDELQDYADRMHGYGVKIHDYGYFSTPNGYAVFLRAECTVFREIWDKPDFRVSKALIQPHITVFETPSRSAAQAVKDFLKREPIHIHTYDIHLSVYNSRSKQPDLFGIPPVFPSRKTIHRDIWRLPKDVLDRASSLGREILRAEASGDA